MTLNKTDKTYLRPIYHFTSEKNWINDPNGFSYYKGQYHLFYQYNPLGTSWGNMSWGHAVSDDLLTWIHLPLAMVQDKPYDIGGVFSGSAIELDDKHLIYYTGVGDPQNSGEQKQCGAVSTDGLHYEKIDQNPLLSGLNHQAHNIDFRDPKVWLVGDKLYMAVATKDQKGGKINIYRTEKATPFSGFQWFGTLQNPDMGFMWECPDYFELEGEHIVYFSAMGVGKKLGMDQDHLVYIGRLMNDTLAGTQEVTALSLMDYGTDFYAPQSMVTPDGRRIVIGWLRMAEPFEGCHWTGMMTLPREVTLSEGKIQYSPIVPDTSRMLDIAPMSILEGDKKRHRIYPYSPTKFYDIHITDRIEASLDLVFGDEAVIQVTNSDKQLRLSRKGMDGNATIYTAPVEGATELNLRLLVDRSVVELFINDGTKVISAIAEGLCNVTSFSVTGSEYFDIEVKCL